MDIANATSQETGLAALLSRLPVQPPDYDINEAGDACMSWEFPGPYFVQLEIPAGSRIATWITWHWVELHDETPEQTLDLNNPPTWGELIRTLEKLAR